MLSGLRLLTPTVLICKCLVTLDASRMLLNLNIKISVDFHVKYSCKISKPNQSMIIILL